MRDLFEPARKGTTRKKIPFEFVLDLLAPLEPEVRPMFGCHAVYVGERIVLILRHKDDYVDDNGVWLATTREHHESLQRDFPSMRSIRLFGGGVTGWQNLPLDAADFEEAVTLACQMVIGRDARIGKVPQRKMKKKAAVKPGGRVKLGRKSK